jgi:hypothetical protein
VSGTGQQQADAGGPEAYEFDADTAIQPAGPGRWTAEVTSRWDVIGGAPNGGYLLAIALRALGREIGAPHPLTATAHYLRRCAPGPVEVATSVVRPGRRPTGKARLLRGDEPAMLLTATFGDLGTSSGPTHIAGGPPDLPPVDGCVAAPPDLDVPPLARRFDMRLDPGCVGWAVGQPTGEARMAGYLRFADGRPPDVWSLPLIADALPPAVLNVLPDVTWVPTLELTVHVRAEPAPGWLRGVFTTRYLADGSLEEDGEVWDSEDRLVALSRQLALARG